MLIAMINKSLDNNPTTSKFYDLEFFENIEYICDFISIET
jgi:hypothetical protein